MKQKVAYKEIGIKPAHFNKLEKALFIPSIEILEKLASLFAVSMDKIVHNNKASRKVITVDEKIAPEQVRLFAQPKAKGVSTLRNISETMLTKQKFQTFFEQKIQTAK